MEMRPGFVSVCVPAYQKPDKLRRCLESVFCQDYHSIEVICTDDTPGSTVQEVVDEFIAAGHPILYSHNDTPLGSPENWNSALSHATGEYVIVLHHDDFFLTPSTLKVLVARLTEDSRVAMAVATARDIDEKGAVLSTNSPTPDQLRVACSDPSILAFGNFLGPPSAVMFRNSISHRFDRRFIWLVDIEFYARVLRVSGGRLVAVQEALVGVSVEPGRLTDFCLSNPTLVMREQLLFFGLVGLGPRDPRVQTYLKQFSAPSWKVLLVAFGFRGMGLPTLQAFTVGTICRSLNSAKVSVKRFITRTQVQRSGRKS